MRKIIINSLLLLFVWLLSITSPAYSRDNPDPGPSAACCLDRECVGDMTQQDCLALGGTWYRDQSCEAGFECPHCGYYVSGDWNGNGIFNIADMIMATRWEKGHDPVSPALMCDCLGNGNYWPVAMDLNASCSFNISDVIWGYGYLMGQPNPLMPCPDCPPGPPPDRRLLEIPSLQSKLK